MYCIENTTEIEVLVYQINRSYFNISYFKLTYRISTVQKTAILCHGHYGCHRPYKHILWPPELSLTCTTINKCSIFVWYPGHWKHFIVTISKSIKMLISWRNTTQNSNHKNLNLINRHSLCFKSLKFDFQQWKLVNVVIFLRHINGNLSVFSAHGKGRHLLKLHKLCKSAREW